MIFYQNEAEKIIAEKQIAELTDSKKYGRPIAVQVVPFEKFWMAEDNHQNYVRLHPSQANVMHESIPRLKRTQAAVLELIKADRKMNIFLLRASLMMNTGVSFDIEIFIKRK